MSEKVKSKSGDRDKSKEHTVSHYTLVLFKFNLLIYTRSFYVVNKIVTLEAELEELRNNEELYQRQHSRVDWLAAGDC